MAEKNTIEEQIKKLEAEMVSSDFWNDKNKAQNVLRELADLKNKKEGFGKYDKGNAILTIISGAGGDDADDFSAMLLSMYLKYADRKGWGISFIHEHKNDHGGYRNTTIEISDPTLRPSLAKGRVGERSGPYGALKNESGVPRLG